MNPNPPWIHENPIYYMLMYVVRAPSGHFRNENAGRCMVLWRPSCAFFHDTHPPPPRFFLSLPPPPRSLSSPPKISKSAWSWWMHAMHGGCASLSSTVSRPSYEESPFLAFRVPPPRSSAVSKWFHPIVSFFGTQQFYSLSHWFAAAAGSTRCCYRFHHYYYYYSRY